MNCFSDEQLNRISHLIREIEKLSDVEKLFLYLQLPCGRTEASEVKGSKPNNGTKTNADLFAKKPDQETTQTYTWILSHLEVDPNVSLPKQEVYDEYRAFCQSNRFEPLCVADFGKAMKHAFPCIKPRRLGQRGNSRYCYSGLRKKYKIQPPNLPDLIEPTFCTDNDCTEAYNQIIQSCRENPDECPLNKSNLPRVSSNVGLLVGGGGGDFSPDVPFGAINLKIDQASQQQQVNSTSYNHQYPSNHSNGPLEGNKQLTGALMQPIGHQEQAAHGQYPQANNLSANHLGSSSTEPRYIYGGLIQQPGTPDDDDYSHNHYQDFNPMSTLDCSQIFYSKTFNAVTSCQLNSTPSSSSSSSGSAVHLAPLAGPAQLEPPPAQPAACMAFYQQPAAAAAGGEQTKTADLISLTGSRQENQTAASSSSQATQSNPFVMNAINHIAVNHFESACASPFQSPASTPFPQHSQLPPDKSAQQQPHQHYHSHISSSIDMVQDYYTSSEFVRYSG